MRAVSATNGKKLPRPLPLAAQVPRRVPLAREAARQNLLQAFSFFNETADSLQGAYRRLQEEVVHLRGELERANSELQATLAEKQRAQALAEMAALLAHEVRNPLASLELFAGLLADATRGQPEARRWADHLQGGLRGLAATVNNVLQLHTDAAPRRMRVELPRLLRETVEFLEPLARQRGMRIELTMATRCAPIAADPQLLQQVFFNLALNAFRAMSPGGELRVHAELPPGEPPAAAVIFRDQGTGIAPEHLARIFEPRFTTGCGAGLGLTVSKKILEASGASVEVESALGQGAAFTLRFPLALEEAGEQA